MMKTYNWDFPAKWLPKWVKDERSRQSKTIIELNRRLKLVESANCPRCSDEDFKTVEEIMKELTLTKQAVNAVKHSVIGYLGDSLDYEGLKPSFLNYLQCIQKLVSDNKMK